MSDVEATEGRLLAGRYRLGELLGKGGMGTVWRAVDETLGRTVAVKELRFGSVDEDEKRRMITRTLREAKATARIRNTGAITVFDVVEEDQRPWIVMELVEGRSLADAIREDGPLTPARAAEVGLVLLDVLKAAHAEGILHRDVKPSNVLIARQGRVVLGDFGIAQIDGDPSVTSTGMLVGAPSYISPERARGQKPGPPADLWSLGALLYAAVEGRPPYDKGSAIATLTAVMTEPIGPMPNAGPLGDVIRGLLAKDPAQRLDEPGARAMLDAVVHAPARPAVPPRTGDERTRMLPADPQPAPTDAPRVPGARPAPRAAARTAVGAAGGGAAATRPASSRPGGPGGPGGVPPRSRPPQGGGLSRRTLWVIAAVVVALLGTVIGVALANSGGGKGGSGGNGTTGGTGTQTTTGTPKATHTHGKKNGGGNGKGDGKDGADSSDDVTPSAGPTDGGGNALPAGWHAYHDAEGFSVAIPRGWKPVPDGQNPYHTGVLLSGGDGRELLVDYTSTPGPSALAKWQHDAKTVGPTMPDYHQIRVEQAHYRSYDAADWEYTRRWQGRAVHVLNRGMVTDPQHGYALLIVTPAGQWDTAADRQARATFFASFKPA